MKEKLLLTVSSLLVVSFAPIYAQELTGTPKENTTETATLSKSQVSSLSTTEREIAVIDAKFAYYSKNQAEYDKAKADGTIDALETKRQQLVLEKNKSSNSSSLKTVELHAVSSGTMSAGKTAPPETVEHINSVIQAIDNKVAHTKSDEYENKLALESGYYEMMAKQRAALVDKREALVKSEVPTK